MRTCGLDLNGQPVRCFPDMDHGLEWSEQLLLKESDAEATLAEALDGFEPAEAELIAHSFQQQVIAAGAYVLKKGEPSDEFYVIIRGRLSIYMTIPGADYRKRLRSYGPGTIVGEMGFFSGEPRSADISADCETLLCSINRERFEALDAIHPDLAGKLCRIILNTLSNRLRDANEQLCQSL
jgi:SulP family sulfate permease